MQGKIVYDLNVVQRLFLGILHKLSASDCPLNQRDTIEDYYGAARLDH